MPEIPRHFFFFNILIIFLDYKYDIIDICITHFFVNVIRYLSNFIFNIFKFKLIFLSTNWFNINVKLLGPGASKITDNIGPHFVMFYSY